MAYVICITFSVYLIYRIWYLNVEKNRQSSKMMIKSNKYKPKSMTKEVKIQKLY